MCLEKAKRVTLKKDKIVYKVVAKRISSGELFSPFRWEPCHLSDEVQHDMIHTDNKEDTIKEFNGHKVVAKPSLSIGKYQIFGGVFHSFENYKDALYLRDSFDWSDVFDETTLEYDYIIVKCIIPKDSKLIMKGICRCGINNFSAFGSSDIILKEIVKEGE